MDHRLSSHSALALVASIAFCGAGWGQAPRLAEVGDPIPSGVGAVMGSADFEGDGDVDLFSTTGVYLNEGGHFTAGPRMPSSFSPAVNIRAVALADFNGDGRVDVLIGRAGGAPAGGALHLAPPAGGSTFLVAATAFTAVAGIASRNELAVADFDQDGDPDVLVADTSAVASAVWQLLTNDGTGSFALASTTQWSTMSTSLSWIGAGDFNGDGLTDAVGSAPGGIALVRMNLGGGVFGPTQSVASVTADSGVVGDFDGDGKSDVFVTDVGGLSILHRGSAGGLLPGATFPSGILGAPAIAADLDGDARADLVRSVVGVSGGTDGSLVLQRGVPSGLAPATSLAAISFGYGNPAPFPGMAAADFDGDGDVDVALAPGRNVPTLIVNRGTAGFAFVPQSLAYGLPSPSVTPQDVDGDGDVDLLSFTPAGGLISLASRRNDGRGGFLAPPVAAGTFASLSTGLPVWGDLDLDGDSDLWVASLSTLASTDVTLINDGAGVFTQGASVTSTAPATAAVLCDIDGDLDLDVVEARAPISPFPAIFSSPVTIRANFTGSTWTYGPVVAFGVPEFISELVAFDAEPDGDVDILAATRALAGGGGPPRLYLNNGFGLFAAAPAFPGVLATTVAVGDLNADGLVDLVLGSQTWLRGAGTYSPGGTHAVPIGSIALADVDGDGALDLVDGAGSWSQGNGAGSFGAAQVFVGHPPAAPIVFNGATRPFVGDLDSDGDSDVMLPDSGPPSTPAIYSNLTRHAGRSTLLTRGSLASLAVFGDVGASWLLAASATGAPRTPLPPFGVLFLDPNAAVVFATGFMPSTRRAAFLATVPNIPALSGVTLSWQGLVGTTLTNGFDTTIFD